MSKPKLPSVTQERKWFDALQGARVDTQRAVERRLRNTISKAYRPLVTKIAKLCAVQNRKIYPLVQSKQKGMRGLIQAIESYNPRSDYRFLTYAVWYIRKSIKEKKPRKPRA